MLFTKLESVNCFKSKYSADFLFLIDYHFYLAGGIRTPLGVT